MQTVKRSSAGGYLSENCSSSQIQGIQNQIYNELPKIVTGIYLVNSHNSDIEVCIQMCLGYI